LVISVSITPGNTIVVSTPVWESSARSARVKPDDRVLGPAVHGAAGHAGHPRDRGEVHDVARAAWQQPLEGELRTGQNTADVDVERHLYGGRILLGEAVQEEHTSVVDDRVELAELLLGHVQESPERLAVADVDR